MANYNALYEFTPEGLEAFQRVFLGTLDENAIDLRDPELGSGPINSLAGRTTH